MAPKIREANCGSRSWNRLPCVLFSREKVSPRRAFTVAPTSIWEHNGSSSTTPSYNNRNPALGVLWSWHREAHRTPRVAIIVTTRLPVVLPLRCHCHLPLLWHNRHYMTPWSSVHGPEGLTDANCICLRFTGTWAHRHRHPVDSCLQARWTRSVLPK